MLLNAKKKGSDKMIKTFRGLLADGGQDRIRLQTMKGKVGYRIVKFQGLGPSANDNIESTLKIYSVLQTSIVDEIDFSDSTLLAAMIITQSSSANSNPEDQTVIFDNEIFNQDIYISLKGADYAASVNYYLELEVIPLSERGAEYTTIKDLRGYTKVNPFH